MVNLIWETWIHHMVSSRLWIQSCLCHGTVGRTKLTRKNKTDKEKQRCKTERVFQGESQFWLFPRPSASLPFGGFIIRICIYLSLEQHKLELHVPTYMWIFFPINPRMWSCGYSGQQWSFQLQGESRIPAPNSMLFKHELYSFSCWLELGLMSFQPQEL